MKNTLCQFKNRFFCCITILLFIFSYKLAISADLNISGQDNLTYENQNYDKLIITNSSNITIRNCNFASATGNVVAISGSNNITIENSDINGLVDACAGVQITSDSSYIYFINNKIHDIADDGVEIVGGDHILFSGNEIFHLYGVGTDGGGGTCYNGHSDGFELGDISDSEFIGNLIYDVRSNAAFFMRGVGSSKNIIIKNNIYYTPESGFPVYIQNGDGIKVYNNTFWQGIYGGIVIGDNVGELEIYNNITHSINYAHFGGSQQPAHHIDHNVLGIDGQGYTMHDNDVVDSDPFAIIHGIGGPIERNVSASDFILIGTSSAIDHGIMGAEVPATDYFGNNRLGFPDIGAIEYGSGSDTTPPVLSNITAVNITDNSALINWITNEQADAQVEYDLTQSYASSTTVDTDLQTSHSMELIDLSSDTLYHYRVKSNDASGNSTVSTDYIFTTLDQAQIAGHLTLSDVVASSYDENVPENTIDDNFETRWSADGDGQWIEYDLETEHRITQIHIAFHKGDQRTMQFDIQVSNDRNSWSNVFSGISSGLTLEQEQFDIPESLARYIRIVGHGNSDNDWNSLVEVDVFGFTGLGNAISRPADFVLLETSPPTVFPETSPPTVFPETSPPTVISLSQGSITWTFSTQVEYGQFVTGDYYIICPSECTITSITPAWNGTANGSQLNPPVGISQGYHVNISGYSATLNVADDTPLAVNGGDMLVSTTGRTPADNRSYMDEAAILTVLPSAPPAGSFRPGYCSDGTVSHNISDLDYSKLSQFAPTPSTPSMATVADWFARPRLDHLVGSTTRYFRPANNMPDYGSYVTNQISDAALMLQLNYTNAEKEALMIGFVQNGIDLYGITETLGPWGTVMGPFAANGGHWGGRKWPILFAGMVLNDTGMKNIGQKSGDYALSGSFGTPPADYIYFAEDDQTFYVTQNEVDCTHNTGCTWNPQDGGEPLTTDHIGMPEWGLRHIYLPEKDNAAWSSSYRSCCTGMYFGGFILAAHIMDAKVLWNHDVLFDYQDRYMAVTKGDPDPFGYTVPGEVSGWRASSDFVEEMWDAYR